MLYFEKGQSIQRYSFWEKILFPPTYLNEKKLRAKLTGKTVLITGASSGIGEQLAYLLAEVPVHLLLVARTADKLTAMKNDLEQQAARVSIFPADLRKEEEIEALLVFINQLPTGVDVVVSNAGHSIRRPIFQSLDRYHDYTRTMAINYFAPVQLLLELLPVLEKNQGQVITVSTVNALLLPIPYWAAYQASKAAFDTWFRSVAPELNARGITTTSIYLPLVKTPMIQPTPGYRDLPAMSPDHVAKIVCRAIYTKGKKYQPWWLIFGQAASLCGRSIWEKIVPWIISRREK